MSRKCILPFLRSGTAVALSLFACVAAEAASTTLPYGDFSGAQVDFLAVRESSSDPLPLFGAPVVQGNELIFSPLNFEAKAEDNGVDGTDSQLNFTLMPDAGFMITGISVTEFGDYTLKGDSVFIGVGAHAFVTVGGSVLSNQDNYSDDTEVDLATRWDLGFSINIPSTTEKVEFVMDNSMVALAGDLDLATIRKKGARISVQMVPVPEPATGLLGLSGIGLAMLCRPRTRRMTISS